MRKWLIALAVLLVAWFALKDMAYRAYYSSGEVKLPTALSYQSGDHWAIQPETPPPGAWETPWGIDAFIILPPTNVAGKHGLLSADNPLVVIDNLRALKELGLAIPGETPAYAPFYRQPSPANAPEIAEDMRAMATADLMSAFEIYLDKANRGRGIVLIVAASASEFTGPIIERLQSDDLSSRFAGLISFEPDETSQQELDLKCADILDGACHQIVSMKSSFDTSRLFLPHLKQVSPPLNIVDPSGIATAIRVQAQNVSDWLDETQPKLAEPFFATEIIESAPIFRPGEETAIGEDADEESETED